MGGIIQRLLCRETLVMGKDHHEGAAFHTKRADNRPDHRPQHEKKRNDLSYLICMEDSKGNSFCAW